jgi:hypothetical protein
MRNLHVDQPLYLFVLYRFVCILDTPPKQTKTRFRRRHSFLFLRFAFANALIVASEPVSSHNQPVGVTTTTRVAPKQEGFVCGLTQFENAPPTV